jgi:hypothetical protein
MNLQPILNKDFLQAHMKLEFDVLGVAGNLAKYLVHSPKIKTLINYSCLHRVPKSQTICFGS